MKSPSANPAPGFQKRPDYRIVTKPAGLRMQVKLNGEVIADSRDALRMEEGEYPAVYYFPRKDVRMEQLTRSDHRTFCPFKGHASYYSFKNGAQNAIWSYEEPFDELRAIRERLAFYPNKVESIAPVQD